MAQDVHLVHVRAGESEGGTGDGLTHGCDLGGEGGRAEFVGVQAGGSWAVHWGVAGAAGV
jgi:hypothetical protein